VSTLAWDAGAASASPVRLIGVAATVPAADFAGTTGPHWGAAQPHVARPEFRYSDRMSGDIFRTWFDGWGLSDKIAVIASAVAFLQFLALIATVFVMRRTGQRQLRAYIVAGATDVDIHGPENEVSVSSVISIKNTGQTPAHELSVVSRTRLLAHPIKMPFDFTLRTGDDPSRTVLGAGQDIESESPAEKPFTGDEMMRAKNPEGGFRIYTWGSVTYRDVFGRKHYTNFCSSLIFDERAALAHASEHHNDAN
jgi:hypothetical protein